MRDGLVFTELPVSHGTQGGVKFIELDLVEMQIVQKVGGKGLQVLGRLYQPAQNGIGVDLEDARCAPDAQPLSETRDDLHDEIG